MSESPSAEPRTEIREAATPDAETDTGELLIEEISIDGMCGVY